MRKFRCNQLAGKIGSIFSTLLTGASLLLLPACTNLWKASIQTMQEPFNKQLDSSQLALDPTLSYLLVEVNGQQALLVMGYQTPKEQIWFSRDSAIFKTQNGYLSGMQGFAINWEIVNGPDLTKFPNLGLPTAYSRVRNVMPGYHYEVRESVLVTPLAGAPSEVPKQLASKPWRWFSEKVTSQYGVQKKGYDYPGLIALDVSQTPYQVAYARQCLSPGFCLSWQTLLTEQSFHPPSSR